MYVNHCKRQVPTDVGFQLTQVMGDSGLFLEHNRYYHSIPVNRNSF